MNSLLYNASISSSRKQSTKRISSCVTNLQLPFETMTAKPEENAKLEGSHEPSPTSTTTDDASQPDQPSTQAQQSSSSPPSEEDTKKWGTYIMGPPAAPTAHPDNQKAALWSASDHQQIYELPYIVYSPAEKPSHNPFEPVINMFNTWSRKTETVARNI